MIVCFNPLVYPFSYQGTDHSLGKRNSKIVQKSRKAAKSVARICVSVWFSEPDLGIPNKKVWTTLAEISRNLTLRLLKLPHL